MNYYNKPSPRSVYLNAIVVGRRIKEHEDIVLKHDFTAYLYVRDIIKERWPEAEETIRAGMDETIIYLYSRDVIQGRWINVESIIVNSQNQVIIEYYNQLADTDITYQWAETEPLKAIKPKTTFISRIKKFFNS